jgi:DNA-3-methyladenine glycosylase
LESEIVTRLDRAFYARDTATVAIDLLGCVLVRREGSQRLAGRIVETEAYLDSVDLASHAAWSRRGRETMAHEPGRVYMYRAYGIHMMFNIVARGHRPAGAVLIRAVEPIAGTEIMANRRRTERLDQLTSGPGKLAQAFALDLTHHLVDLVEDNGMWLEAGPQPNSICVGPRIGITKSADFPLRFFEEGNQFVSATRRGHPLPAEARSSWALLESE